MTDVTILPADDQELPGMPPSPTSTDDQAPGAKGGRPSSRTGGRKAGARKAPAKRPGGDAARRKQARANKQADYSTGVAELLRFAAVAPVIAGKATGNPAFLADAVALSTHAPTIAGAVSELAVNDARIAAVLDRLVAIGPYSGLVAALTPLVVQLGANHRVFPAAQAKLLGAVEPAELVAELDAQIAAQMRADAAAFAEAHHTAPDADPWAPKVSEPPDNGATPHDATEPF